MLRWLYASALVLLFSATTPALAAITFVGSQSATSGGSGTSTLTINRPTGVVAGDVLVAVITARGGNTVTITAPTGWQVVRRTNAGGTLVQAVFFRVVTATEPASYTWGLAPAQRVGGAILGYRGVSLSQPVDVSSGGTGNGTLITAPSLNANFSDSLLLGFFGTAHGNASVTINPPQSAVTGTVNTGAGFNGVALRVGSELRLTAGPTGNRSATSSRSANNIGQLVALRPAPVLRAEYRFDECGYTGAPGEVLDTLGVYPATAKNVLNTGAPGIVNRFGTFDTYAKWAQTSIPLATDWSLSVWFKTPFMGTHRWHVLASVAGGGDLLYLDANNNYRWGVYTTTGITDGSFRFGTLGPGWHHLVITGQGNRTNLYIDGSFKESVARKTSGTLTYLGTSYDFVNTPSAQGFAAPLDEMRIYDHVLHPSEITTIYTHQLAGKNADGSSRPPVSCGATPGRFNAFEPTTPPGSITGVIKTKVAGQSFSLDLVAINTAGTGVETGFTGGVKVELLDASNNSGALDANGCRSSWTPIQTLSPNPVFNPGNQGRITVSFQENEAWADVRVRVSYPATGTPTVIGCSNDNFAIRPAYLAWTATDADWASPGTARTLGNTSATGGVVHKAGRPFTLTITAYNALNGITSNYTGNPAGVTAGCLLPSGCAAVTPSVGSLTGAGTRISHTAQYSEVGVIDLRVEDATFANVDSSDSTAAERTIPGATHSVGRFVPDHFELSPANTPVLKTFNDSACASRSFTYVGQPFGYVTPPAATVAAKNAAGQTTANYRGSLWKLMPVGVSQAYASLPATPALSASMGAPTVVSNGDGTGTITVNGGDTLSYARPTTAPWPGFFNANISLSLSVQDASENGPGQGIITTTVPAVFNGGGSGIAFDAGNAFRFGRVRLANAHGSERLPLNVPVLAEYFDGTIFLANTEDNCSAFTLGTALAFSNWQRNLNPGETAPTAATLTLAGGKGAIPLSAPGAGNSGSVDLTLDVPAWLEFPWSGAALADPRARASFGLYRGGDGMIYRRESY